MALAAGDRLGPYEILEWIGSRERGDLYRARDTRADREVAIQFANYPDQARAATALHHPHIQTLYEIGPDYLVTEWLDGVPLKGPLSLRETLRFAGEICDALEFGHQLGISHSDLTPENVLVTRQGIKLLGFGVAEGSPAGDLRACGGLLYEMLMGRPVTADRRPVQPPALERVFEKCLAQDPAQRWQSASELKQALATVSQTRGHRREYIVGVGSIAMLIVGLALLVMQFPSYQKLSDKDVLVLGEFRNTTGDAIFDGTLRSALAIELQQSPFLKIMDDEQTRQDLKLLGRSPDTRISNAIAHDICIREHDRAMMDGSIADLGKTFAITIQAVDCRNGATLAREQAQAEGREGVLPAIAKATTGLRAKLGEPPGSLPALEHNLDPGTGSITALQLYSLGIAQLERGNEVASTSFFQRAIELDPRFAFAYLGEGRAWALAGESAKARQAYQDFFQVWKGANPNVPVIEKAKQEFAALK